MNSFRSELPITSTVAPRLVVPRHDRGVLVDPPLAQLIDVVQENQSRLAGDISIYGVSLRSWREETRAAVIAESRAYTDSLVGDSVEPSSNGPLIVTGHQPELFHAGVWAKNFAAAGLAQRVAGTSLNLIIDNDTVATSRIKVPVGTREAPGIEWIPFDSTVPQRPWEEATISDAALFESFGQRVTERIHECWNYVPLIANCWPASTRHSAVSRRVCDCLAAARLAVERSHGVRNLEVPMSRVCSTRPFHRFVAAILCDLPQFHSSYNQIVRDYRRKHHLRSTTHPVPELETNGEWLEAPFWIWRAGDQRRDRPFARRAGDVVELRDFHGLIARLPLKRDHALDHGAEVLQELANERIRLRTRALTTTLFARVFLSDLFIHGIGGAKYDAMTDSICHSMLQIIVPHFATISATAFPPLPAPFQVTETLLKSTEHQVRDVLYNPDRHLSEDVRASCRNLIQQKQFILKAIAGRHPTSVEHRQLAEINSQLGAKAAAAKASLQAGCDVMRDQLRANAVLKDREFSWCLHPEAAVTSFLRTEFLG